MGHKPNLTIFNQEPSPLWWQLTILCILASHSFWPLSANMLTICTALLDAHTKKCAENFHTIGQPDIPTSVVSMVVCTWGWTPYHTLLLRHWSRQKTAQPPTALQAHLQIYLSVFRLQQNGLISASIKAFSTSKAQRNKAASQLGPALQGFDHVNCKLTQANFRQKGLHLQITNWLHPAALQTLPCSHVDPTQ